MKCGSLFSGIGGLDLGLERAGFEIRWQVEIDDWCRRILTKHWPDVPKYGDVREVGENLERVDIICGGFPCQPVSYAGKGLAQQDTRWLWPEFERVLGLLRPRYALIENVPGLYDRGLSDVLSGLAALGYDAEWTHISAAEAGAPHLRERIFIVADASFVGRNGSAYFDGRYDIPYYRAWDAAKGISNWRGWERWLNEANQAGITADADCEHGEEYERRHQLQQTVSQTSLGRCGVGSGGERVTASLLLGVDDGVPHRVDRLRGLGNAVVPQVAEYIGRRILEGRTA